VADFHRIGRREPGSVHPCRGGPHTGTSWGLRVCHQPPEHLDGLKHACVQLSVGGLPALGLAAGDLSGEGGVLGPAPEGLPADADQSGDLGGGMTGQEQVECALLLGLHSVVVSGPSLARGASAPSRR
jgi:hypothetical protein